MLDEGYVHGALMEDAVLAGQFFHVLAVFLAERLQSKYIHVSRLAAPCRAFCRARLACAGDSAP